MSEEYPADADLRIREALAAEQARYPVPPFDLVWTAAADSVAVAPGRRFQWLAVAASLAVVVTALAAALIIGPSQPGGGAAPDPAPWPVVWYTPTDSLLPADSLSYAAQPARLTVYDPINLEVIQ